MYLPYFFRIGFRAVTIYTILTIVGVALMRSIFNHKLCLGIDINLKGYEEADHFLIFVAVLLLHSVSTFGGARLCLLTLSCFLFFSRLIMAQLKLIALHVRNLPLKDASLTRSFLSEITFLHLDVLR